MSDTSKPCSCGHEQAKHEGLQRRCLATDGRIKSFFGDDVGLTLCDCTAFRCADPAPLPAPLPAPPMHDPVNHPRHYTRFPDGVEPIQLAQHLTYNLGSAVAYLSRAGFKGDAVEDMRKAIWHVEREIERIGAKR